MLLVLLCLLLVSSNLSVQSADVESAIAVKAINGVIKSYFAKEGSHISLVYSGLVGGNAETMSEKILQTKSDDVVISYTIASLNEYNQKFTFGSSTVFIFDSMQFFEKFAKATSEWTSKNGFWHKHLVYAPGLTAADILLHFKTGIAISEVGFLIKYSGSSLHLVTAFIYTKQKCRVNQIRTINRFSEPFVEWESDEFYPDKYKSFHGCPLDVYYGDDNTMEQFYALGDIIFNELAKSFNFSINEIKSDSSTFNSKKVSDLSNNIWFRDEMGGDPTKFHVSSTLYMEELTILVPAGLPLTDLEKMVVMFDTETWIAIGFTFAVAFITIQVINWMSRKVQNFVFGRDIRAPTLNTVSVFLTGGQHRLPGRNFARYLLMMFMMWSLIFRTCFQSKMFENLQSDMRHSRVCSFDDFNRMNFTLLIRLYEGTNSHGWTEILNGRIKNIKEIPPEEDIYKLMVEPEGKFGMIEDRNWYKIWIKRKLRSGLPSTRLLDESFEAQHYSLMLTRKLPYTERFLRKVNELIAGGIIKKAREFHYEKHIPNKKNDEIEPQILTFWQLGLGFIIFLIACAISIVAFMLELAIEIFKFLVAKVSS